MIKEKIKNGMLYSICSSERICGFDNGLNSGDFRNISEDLYRTKKGSWFIYGAGGSLTKYGKKVGNMTCGSEDFIPITDEEARKFIEDHGDKEIYMKYFELVEA